MLNTRGRLLLAALGFVNLRTAPRHPALDALHGYLDSWRGIGAFGASTQRGRGFTQQERDALVAWIRGSMS